MKHRHAGTGSVWEVCAACGALAEFRAHATPAVVLALLEARGAATGSTRHLAAVEAERTANIVAQCARCAAGDPIRPQAECAAAGHVSPSDAAAIRQRVEKIVRITDA